MSDFLVPAEPACQQITVKGSRFIARIAPAFSVAEAKDFIELIRQENVDATHHVPVYLIGHGPSVTAHCSDAGEPSGTAGRPALSVLQGSGLGDVVMVITRYYGGTKLGTGGLVKAYSEAARLAVLAVPKARKVPVYEGMLRCHYQFYERIVHLINGCEGKVLKEEFAELVSIAYSIPASCFDKFQRNVDGMSSGQIKLSITDRDKIDLVAVQ